MSKTILFFKSGTSKPCGPIYKQTNIGIDLNDMTSTIDFAYFYVRWLGYLAAQVLW
jgi:hypothetical protein